MLTVAGPISGSPSAVKTLSQTKKVDIEALFELLKSNKSNVVQYAEKKIGELGEEAIPYLLSGLNDKDVNVRKSSSSILLYLQHDKNINLEEAIPALVQALRDEETEVADYSRNALIRVGGKSVPALVRVLEKNPYQKEVNYKWYWNIISTLAGIEEEARDAIDHLNLRLGKCNLNDPAEVRLYEHILYALKEIGGKRVVDILKDHATRKYQPESMRHPAISHLAQIAYSKYDEQ